MAVIQSGALATDLATVDPGSKSLRVNNRPIISGTLGSYTCAQQSGVMAAGLAANAPVWAMRYAGANLCIVEKVIFDGLGSIVGFAAGVVQLRLFVKRANTTSASAGTSATLTGNNCKLRTSYATTGVADIRIASTAILTPGGGANDIQPAGAVLNGVPATAGIGVPGGVFYDAHHVGHPIILATNEGLELQATVPATGTWIFGVSVRWTEVTAAEWV